MGSNPIIFNNNMLLKKKIFHLNYYFKKNVNNKLIKNISLYYKLLKNKTLKSFISLHLYFFWKRKIQIRYHYSIKMTIQSLTIFNSILIIFFNILKNIVNSKLRFNLIKKSKKYYTVLRSPFVYKSSQEHYLLESFIGIIIIILNYNNFFFIKYWEFFLKKTLLYWLSSTVLIKRFIKII
jgi:hypothetical protein